MRRAACAAAIFAWAGATARAGEGPVAARAHGFEYVRHDETTGIPDVRITADEARADQESVVLDHACLVRFDRAGRPRLRASAEAGRIAPELSAVLSGRVVLAWHLDAAEADFRCSTIAWDRARGTVATDDEVRGRIGPADGGAIALTAVGLEIRGQGQGGRLGKDVVLELCDEGGESWLVSADGGMEFESADGVVRLRLRGPVVGRGARVVWGGDGADVVLRPGASGRLAFVSGWLGGSVRAAGELADDVLAGPGLDARRFETAATAADLKADRTVILHGTVDEPAHFASSRGRLCGVRVEISPRGARSEGGAVSVFEWGAQE